MAKKITELPVIALATDLADADITNIVDNSASLDKQVTLNNLFDWGLQESGKNISVKSSAPILEVWDTDGGSDSKRWQFSTDSTKLYGRTRTDANGAGVNWIEVTRSGTSISNVKFPQGTLTVSNAAILSSTLAVTSTSTFSAAVTVSSGGIDVTGDSIFQNDVSIQASSTRTLLGKNSSGGNNENLFVIEGEGDVSDRKGEIIFYRYANSNQVGIKINTYDSGIVNAMEIDHTGTVEFAKAVTVSSGGINVTGNSTITGTLDVSSTLTVSSGGINVTGNSTITGTLDVSSTLTISSGGATITGNSDITGTLDVSSTLTISSGGIDVTGTSTITGDLDLIASSTEARGLDIGLNRSGDGTSFIDLIGDATYSDYGCRLQREGGSNANSSLLHRGTGELRIQATDAGSVVIRTNSTDAITVNSSQETTFSAGVTISSGGIDVTGDSIFQNDVSIQASSTRTLLGKNSSGGNNENLFVIEGEGDVSDRKGEIIFYRYANSNQVGIKINTYDSGIVNAMEIDHTGTVEFAQAVTVSTGGVTVSTGGIDVTGDSDITGTLDVSSTLTVSSGGIDVTGSTTFNSLVNIDDQLNSDISSSNKTAGYYVPNSVPVYSFTSSDSEDDVFSTLAPHIAGSLSRPVFGYYDYDINRAGLLYLMSQLNSTTIELFYIQENGAQASRQYVESDSSTSDAFTIMFF